MVSSATISLKADFILNEKLTLSIFDLNGKMIKQMEMKNESSIQIDRDGMSSGIYLVNIASADHGSVTKRIVVE
jgi:hypothetical protein